MKSRETHQLFEGWRKHSKTRAEEVGMGILRKILPFVFHLSWNILIHLMSHAISLDLSKPELTCDHAFHLKSFQNKPWCKKQPVGVLQIDWTSIVTKYLDVKKKKTTKQQQKEGPDSRINHFNLHFTYTLHVQKSKPTPK